MSHTPLRPPITAGHPPSAKAITLTLIASQGTGTLGNLRRRKGPAKVRADAPGPDQQWRVSPSMVDRHSAAASRT
jgi:hypothetical protein